MERIINVLSLLGAIALSIPASAQEKVIYGEDDRRDLFEAKDQQQVRWAKSTVALILRETMTPNGNGDFALSKKTFGQSMRMCSTEKFVDQPNAAFCSGALIGPNLILTAGHCITDASDCAATAFVFDYSMSGPQSYPFLAKKQNVFNCKRIVKREELSDGPDWAVVEIDRPVVGRIPLRFARRNMFKEISNGTELVMIGHPAGLPTKIDDGGKVRDNSKRGYFIATTDSFGGNSGSAVLNKRTGQIEGVLVRGETDYLTRNGCRVSNTCSETGCRGEDVTKVSSVNYKNAI